jgi:hypothetical protein
MTKREAKRIAYAKIADFLESAASRPIRRADGVEFSGEDQVLITEVFLELRDSFMARSTPRAKRKTT